MNAKTIRLLPLLLLFFIVLLGGLGLFGGHDEARTPSPMIGKQVAFFDMPVVVGNAPRFTPHIWQEKIIVLNFFASWCQPCIAEHPALMKLAQSGKVEIYGVSWKDSKDKTIEWLRARGNPYQMVGLDISGKSAIVLGIIGVPETYVIDNKGVVRYSYRSQLTDDIINNEIVPLVDKLRAENAQ